MKKCLILSFLIFVCVLSNAQKFDSAQHYQIKNFNAAIFPKEYERILYADTTIKLRFTATVNEILLAYKALNSKEYDNYKWQFFGYINSKGEKLLSINGFSWTDASDWLQSEIIMDDGGCSYWQALYNLDTGKIVFFSCNGEA